MASSSPCRYDWLGIHEEMLRDKVRVEAYRRAILENAPLFRGRRVLEVGCGTGILSLFAAKAGAAVVYAVDSEAVCAEMTQKVAVANGFGDVIKPMVGRVEEVELPSKVDILISEWMGYFLLYENMLDAVLEAKRRFLEPGGIVFPTVVELFVAPFTDAPMQSERRRFWSDIGGMDLSVLLPKVLNEFAVEPRIEGLAFDQILREPIRLWRHDFREDSPSGHADIGVATSWHCPSGAVAHGYVGWFDCRFDASPLRRAVAPARGLDGAALAEHLAQAFAARFGPPKMEAVAPGAPGSEQACDAKGLKRKAGDGEAAAEEDTLAPHIVLLPGARPGRSNSRRRLEGRVGHRLPGLGHLQGSPRVEACRSGDAAAVLRAGMVVAVVRAGWVAGATFAHGAHLALRPRGGHRRPRQSGGRRQLGDLDLARRRRPPKTSATPLVQIAASSRASRTLLPASAAAWRRPDMLSLHLVG